MKQKRHYLSRFKTSLGTMFRNHRDKLLNPFFKVSIIWLKVTHYIVTFYKFLYNVVIHMGGNSQNFSRKFVRFFLTLKCFYIVVTHRKQVFYDFYSSEHHPLTISASKTTSSHYNLKILRPKVNTNFKIFCKKFCEFPQWYFDTFQLLNICSVTLFLLYVYKTWANCGPWTLFGILQH